MYGSGFWEVEASMPDAFLGISTLAVRVLWALSVIPLVTVTTGLLDLPAGELYNP